jgi:META domain
MRLPRCLAAGAIAWMLVLAFGFGIASARGPEGRPYEAGEFEWRLENKSFVATSVKGVDGATPISKPKDVHLAFGWTAESDGPWLPVLVWEANCNEYFYRFEATAERLTTSEGGSTLVGCFGPLGREDRWLDRFFSADPLWRLKEGRLTLAAGKRVVKLRQTKHFR